MTTVDSHAEDDGSWQPDWRHTLPLVSPDGLQEPLRRPPAFCAGAEGWCCICSLYGSSGKKDTLAASHHSADDSGSRSVSYVYVVHNVGVNFRTWWREWHRTQAWPRPSIGSRAFAVGAGKSCMMERLESVLTMDMVGMK